MPESFASRRLRWMFNLHPGYRGTGGRVRYVASDFSEIRIEIPLSWRTRNAVGTIFGGSMYGAADPIFMIMLMKILGPEYVVWDKIATIRFKRPGRTTLRATFRIEAAEVQAVRDAAASGEPIDRVYVVDLTDEAGTVHATVEKTIYIRRVIPRLSRDPEAARDAVAATLARRDPSTGSG